MTELRVIETAEPGEAAVAWCGGSVPAGHTVETAYVPIHDVVCRAGFGHQLYPAEVERAYKRQLEGDQAWPPPTGYWRERRFVLTDGRNRYVAALMLGVEHLLVCWLVPPR